MLGLIAMLSEAGGVRMKQFITSRLRLKLATPLVCASRDSYRSSIDRARKGCSICTLVCPESASRSGSPVVPGQANRRRM